MVIFNSYVNVYQRVIRDTSFVDMALELLKNPFQIEREIGAWVFRMECRRPVVQPDDAMASTQT